MIHNIIKIEQADCSQLSVMEPIGERQCHFMSDVNFTEINTYGNIQVSEESDYQNNERIWTITVTYKQKCKKPSGARRKAFRLTRIDGTQFVIGTYDRPFPVIKESNPYPDKPTGTTLMTVTVTWKSKHGMMEIV